MDGKEFNYMRIRLNARTESFSANCSTRYPALQTGNIYSTSDWILWFSKLAVIG